MPKPKYSVVIGPVGRARPEYWPNCNYSVSFEKRYGNAHGHSTCVAAKTDILSLFAKMRKEWEGFDDILNRKSDPITLHNLEFIDTMGTTLTKEELLSYREERKTEKEEYMSKPTKRKPDAPAKPGLLADAVHQRQQKPLLANHVEPSHINALLAALKPNPFQPRTVISPEHVREIAESIAQVGLLQEPLVREVPRGDKAMEFEIAFGHVRVAALRLLQEENRWPWPTVRVEVRPLTDTEMALIALSENRKRKDISPIEEARAIKKALDEIKGLKIQDVADTLGVDHATLSNTLRVLQLPALVLDRVDSGELSLHAAREFLCLMGERHAHVHEMEMVVTEISGSRMGSAPDWRVGNVRRLLSWQVSGSSVSEWRRIGSLNVGNDRTYGASHASPPLFDTEAFGKEFAGYVHILPWDEQPAHNAKSKQPIHRSLAWTCQIKDWVRWQTSAQKDAQATGGSATRATKAGQEREAAFLGALAKDPVYQKLAKPPKTKTKKETRGAEPIEAEAETPPVSPETLPGVTEAPPQPENLGDIVHGLHTEVSPGKAPPSKDPPPPKTMTPEIVEALGTRATLVNLRSYKGFVQRLEGNTWSSDTPPTYFDRAECRSCVIGAAYGYQPGYGDKPTLVCTNAERFREKLLRDRAAFVTRFKARMAQEDKADLALAEAFKNELAGAPRAAFALANYLLDGRSFRIFAPNVGEGYRLAEEHKAQPITHTDATIVRVRDLLDLKAGDEYRGFSGDEAVKKLREDEHDQATVAAAASLLLVYEIRAGERRKEKEG